MKKILLFFMVVLLAISAYASGIIETQTGFVYVSSVDRDEIGKGDYKDLKPFGICDGLIVKYDKELNLVKKVNFGTKGFETTFKDVTELPNGDIVAVGETVPEDPSSYKENSSRNLVLVKYDKDLKEIKKTDWGIKYNEFVRHIITTKEGKIALCGQIYNEDDVTFAYIAVFDENFVDIANPFVGSFKEPNDAKFTTFENLTETPDGNFVAVGYTANRINEEATVKAITVMFDKDLNVIKKMSYGDKKLNIVLSDITINPQGGYMVVGYVDDIDQKGIILELDKDLKKISSEIYMPDKFRFNSLTNIELFKGNSFGFFVKGAGGDTETSDYYLIYRKTDTGNFKFQDFCTLPERTCLDFVICKDTKFVLISKDYENNKLIIEENPWF